MRRFAVLTAAAALAACQPQTPDGGPAAPPADAPPAAEAPAPAPPPERANPFEVDLILRGNEPFWAVNIGAGEMTLKRPDHSDVVVAKPKPTVEAGKAVWKAAAFTATVSADGPCSDGMSDRVYPYSASVEVGGETMTGCAARADEVYAPA